MMHVNVGLLWRVPDGGHTWVSATRPRPGENGTIPVRVLAPHLGVWREYHPLRDEPELFRRFAELELPEHDDEASEETVRQFADRYGDLGIGMTVLVRQPTEEAPATAADFRISADLLTWRQTHWLLLQAVQIWDALQAGDTAALERRFPWTDAGHVRACTFTPDGGIPSFMSDGKPMVQFFDDHMTRETLHLGWSTDPADYWVDWPSSPVHWAMAYLRGLVNRHLGEYTKLRVRWMPASPEKMPLRLGVVPETLLGGMWWQLAQVIDGGLRYERCALCGQWFRVMPRGNRQNTRFCSPYCRVKANRRTHQQRPKKKKAATRDGASGGHGAPMVL